jgi:hypothetical protein
MLPTASPFRQAIDYRQSFQAPEPAVQRFNPLEKLAQLFQPRPRPDMGMQPPAPPVPTPAPYGDPAMTMQRPRGIMGGMSDTALPEILMALGTGIASNNLAAGTSMLPGLMEQASERRRTKKELANSMQSRESLARMLEEKGETDLAAGVRGGYLDTEDAFNTYMDALKEKKAAANKPVLDEFGIERNPDGSFKNRFDEERYNREKMKADIETQKLQGDLSKQEMERKKFEAEIAANQKKEQLNAPPGKREAAIGGAFDTIYQTMGVDPQTGEALPGGPPRNTLIDKMLPESMAGGAGWGSLLSILPETNARQLQGAVDTLISEIITSEIRKLKAAGVAPGQITEYENKMFARLQGSLDLGQRPEQVIRNIRVLDETMKRYAETGQPLLEDDPALAAITQGAPDSATMQQPAPAPAPEQGQPITVNSEAEAMAQPPGTIVILNGRRFRVE